MNCMNKSIRPRDNKGRLVKTTREVVPTFLNKAKPPTTNLLAGNKKETRKRIVVGSSKQTQTK
jgi:hypothetical protein